MDQECLCCGKLFPARNDANRYCAERACQRARKREWERYRLLSDPVYKANKADAQRRWRETHPEYWRTYRDNHPNYVRRNRERQHHRNLRRVVEGGKAVLQPREMIAKTDARLAVKSGTYRLIPLVPVIAKTDAMVVELSVISSP